MDDKITVRVQTVSPSSPRPTLDEILGTPPPSVSLIKDKKSRAPWNHGRLHASYLSNAITDVSGLVKTARRILRGTKFDAVVGTGFSGAMFVPILAYSMRKRFALVRKKDDNSNHSDMMVESGLLAGDKWLFVDDFMSSGNTRRRVVEMVAEHHHNGPVTYVGDYLYKTHSPLDTHFAKYIAKKQREEIEL